MDYQDLSSVLAVICGILLYRDAMWRTKLRNYPRVLSEEAKWERLALDATVKNYWRYE